ncbi:MAG: hypothetical protein V3V15_03185 [Sphingorhabdus sp.]
MSIFSDVSFKGAGNDLIGYLRAERPYRLLLWVAACVPPALLVLTLYFDVIRKSTPPEPGVFYFESWPETRSMEDIKRDHAVRAEKARAIRLREKEGYKTLGRAIGMDVEKIEREAEAKRAAAKKAEAEEAAKTGGAGKSDDAATGAEK